MHVIGSRKLDKGVNSLRRCVTEVLEARMLMSVTADLTPHRPVGASSDGYSSPLASGLISPGRMREAYGLGTFTGTSAPYTYNYGISFNGVQGSGAGQTIALIEGGDDPDISSDLASFDSYWDLPAPPSFQQLTDTGGTIAAGANPDGENGVDGELCLDVEWAHVIAPLANISVYCCSTSQSLYTAMQTAASATGVSVISVSYGLSGSQSDSFFYTPSGHQGVTYFASAGDNSGDVQEPEDSASVVSVGGTSLTVNSNNAWSSETVWGSASTKNGGAGTGGGINTGDSQPSYQKGIVSAYSTTNRTTPDISADANPNTGVAVYDSFDDGTSAPWQYYGGTSLSSPMIAAMVAVADQGRVAEGLGTLDGYTQTLPRLYSLYTSNYAANFHDITSGASGTNAAGTGYDMATGLGSPIGSSLIPDLAGAATITGRAFVDNSGNGVYGGTDTPIAGQTVYLDLNNDGVLDNSEPSATTNAQGIYSFSDKIAGGVIRMSSAAPAGYTLTSASAASIVYGQTDTVNFVYQAQSGTKLVFAQQPATANQGATMSPVVVDIDTSAGSVAPNDTSTVTLTLSSGTFSTGLNTASATAVAGVATFNSLVINTGGTYTLTASDGSLTTAVSNSFSITKATPIITWPAPASISYETPLSSTQLDATANVAGTFSYSPAAGTILKAGQNQTLSVTFTPYDTADYQNASGTTTITVNAASITLTGPDLYLRRESPTSDNLDVWDSTTDTGSPAQVLSFSSIGILTLTATATGDTFIADFSNGSVAPEQQLSVKGIGSQSNNSLTLVGTGGSDSIFVSGNTVGLNSLFILTTKIGNLYFQSPGAGESLNLSSGSLTLAPDSTGSVASEVFSSLTIGDGAELLLPTASTSAARILLQTGALNIASSAGLWTGTLDLANNDLDVSNGDLGTLNSQVAQGYVSRSVGIISSAAQNDTTQLTMLGVIQNSADGTTTGPALYGSGAPLGTFDGANPANTDVLVKYTYFGDADLSGTVDGSDYARIDSGTLTSATGWYNGDFNYDGSIDGSDYTLIDNACNTQGASLAAEVSNSVEAVRPALIASTPNSPFSSVPIEAAEEKKRNSLVFEIGLST